MSPPIAHAAGADETAGLVLLFAGIWVAWIGWSRLRGKGHQRLPRWGAWVLLVVAAALIVAATTVPRALFGPSTPVATSGPRPSSTATLTFVSPREGLRTDGDQLVTELRLDGATLTQETSASVAPNVGHLHLSLDGAVISMAGTTEQVVDLRSLAPGEHTLTATFVAADHLPFDPPVTASVTFVKEPSG